MYTFYINTFGGSTSAKRVANTVSVLILLGNELCDKYENDPSHELLTMEFSDGKTHQYIEGIEDIRQYLGVLEHAYNNKPK